MDLVRWPPEDYRFESRLRLSDQGGEGYEESKAVFIKLYPELSHWEGRSLSEAWGEFAQWATCF